MSRAKYFLYYKDVQECLTSYWEENHRRINFAKAALDLHNRGKSFSKTLQQPDYADWDSDNLPQLKELFAYTVINITEIIEHPEVYVSLVSEPVLMFEDRDTNFLFLLYDEAVHIHQHDFFEIIYVLSGESELTFESEKRILHSGELVVIAPYTRHCVIQLTQDCIVLNLFMKKSTFESSFFNLLRGDDVLSAFLGKCLYDSTKNYLLFMSPLTHKVRHIIKEILVECNSDQRYSNEVCNCLISILFSEIMRTYSSTYSYYEPEKSSKVQIPQILHYIKSNYQHINLEEVAAFFNYDAAYLGKMIRRGTGMYFNDIVNKYKIDRAKSLLKYTKQSIAQVSEASGFNSTNHFYQVFKKTTGMTPTAYRKSYLESPDEI